MNKPKVSIIIRTYNEEKMIGMCLKAIFSQKTKFPFEVIIIDSESNDKTVEIVSKFSVEIVKIRKKYFTYGLALNRGCLRARGKYLISLSAHAVPIDRKWLDTLIDNFKDPKIAGVYGKQIPFEDCEPLNRRLMLDHWKDEKKIQSKDPFFVNSNSVILKGVWQKIKFDEKLTSSEDHDWAKRVQQKGYVVIYEPKAIVSHSHNENFKQFYTRTYREVYSNIIIYGKKIIPRYLSNSFYDFYQDIRYILINRYSPLWIAKSLVKNMLSFTACSLAFIRAISER